MKFSRKRVNNCGRWNIPQERINRHLRCVTVLVTKKEKSTQSLTRSNTLKTRSCRNIKRCERRKHEGKSSRKSSCLEMRMGKFWKRYPHTQRINNFCIDKEKGDVKGKTQTLDMNAKFNFCRPRRRTFNRTNNSKLSIVINMPKDI